jgi:hypothetical protein
MAIINLGGGNHTPDSTWNNALVVFDLSTNATVNLPKADTLPANFEFSYILKSVTSHGVEFRTSDDGDVLNGHWRTKHPVITNGVHTGWGDAMRWGLFACLTQTSGKVWKLSDTEYGFSKSQCLFGDPISQDTVTVLDVVGSVWKPTPKSSGEVIAVTNAAQGSTPAGDIFLDFGNLKDWCPAHLVSSFGFGNYLNQIITIHKVDDTKVSGTGRVVGIGSFHSSAPRCIPSNDHLINPGYDRGFFYLTKPSTCRLRVTQNQLEILDYWEHSNIPTART